MEDVVKFLDAKIASTKLELERLERARSVVAAPALATAAGPVLALPVAAVTAAPPSPPPADKRGRPRGPAGNGSGPQSKKKYCGPEIVSARVSLAALMRERGPLTNKKLAELSRLPKWKVQAALMGWEEVAKTGPGLRAPWQLKSVGYVAPNDPAIAASVGPTG